MLQLCAYTDTLILDEEGIYDPSAFNDRLLLGLKGTMSEAELHLLRSRLRGGILNKARRGELALRLPVGLVRLADGRCARDPDAGIQASITAVFEAFAATGTVASTVRRLLACSIRFAKLVWGGEKAGTIIWCDYNRTRVLNVLTNPAYAGAYAYGRRRCRQAPDGHVERRKLKPDAWAVVIPDRFTGCVSWTDFEGYPNAVAQQCAKLRSTQRLRPAARRAGAGARPRNVRAMRQPDVRPLRQQSASSTTGALCLCGSGRRAPCCVPERACHRR